MGDERVSAVKYVGPATAEALAEASFGAADIRGRGVSYRMLVDAGVNPGVAARIRREHSLPWSLESEGDDLDRRSAQVRGLGDAERAWVAASSGDWQEQESEEEPDGEAAWVAASGGGDGAGAKADGSGDPVAAESAWRDRARPTPVGTLDGVNPAEAADLAEAGITSVRALASADPEAVAAALDRDADRVAELRDAAVDHAG